MAQGEIYDFCRSEVEGVPVMKPWVDQKAECGGIIMKTKIVTALAVFALTGYFATAAFVYAETNVNVNLGIPVPVVVAPQPVYIAQPPEMVAIPQSNVYFAFAPGVSVDLFFYDNRWWNRRGNLWYRASGYNGPWVAVEPRYVPVPVYRVPADYRTVYVHEKRVPYGQWKKAHGEHGGKHKGNKHGKKHGHHDD
jgi:hypothetical protein